MNHPTTHPTDTRRLRPYEFIATPAITLVLDAIGERLEEGQSFAPGVRALASWAGLRSAGQISRILYQLTADGWIAYDNAGTITLLHHPDQDADRSPDQDADRRPDQDADPDDQGSDPGDQGGDGGDQHPDRWLDHAADRADQELDRAARLRSRLASCQRVPMRSCRVRRLDQSADRIARDMVLEIHEQQQDLSAAAHENLSFMAQADQRPDRLHPAAQALTELGAHETIIAEALNARPDLTAQQVEATWAWHQWRRERSGGRLGEGVFFHAIRRGQIHAAPEGESADGVIDVDAYTSGAYGDLFRRGGDVSDLEGWTAPTPQVPSNRPLRSVGDAKARFALDKHNPLQCSPAVTCHLSPVTYAQIGPTMFPDCPTDLIAILSTTGHYRYASPAYAALLGYPPAALSGTSFFDRVHRDDLALVTDHWSDLLLHGTARATFRYRHARGGWCWIEFHDRIVRLDGTAFIIVLRRDLSSQAAQAAELLQTHTLACIGQMASGIAHDFANLLMGIGDFADLALEQLPADSPVRAADLAQIQRAAERGESLIHQFLALMRRPTSRRHLLNLDDLIRELSMFLRRIIGAAIVLDTALSLTLTRPPRLHLDLHSCGILWICDRL